MIGRRVLGSGKRLSRLALASASALALLTSEAAAQSTAAGRPATEAESDDDEEIVVTGSRLRRGVEETPIPVTTVSTEDIELSGATYISDIVNEIPALGQGTGRTNAIGIAPSGGAFGVGSSLLNLRNLGSTRTLVVVDGRRHVGGVPGNTAVDVNTIPTALVDRVEVSTGGASVAYGADAVSGVVNFILKRDFEGFRFDAQSGVHDEGDGADYYLAGTGGLNFGDGRGNATLNVSWNQSGGIDGADRKNIARNTTYGVNPANTSATDGIPARILFDDIRFATTAANGLLQNFVTGRQVTFSDDGTPRVFNPGQSIGGGQAVGGDGLNIVPLTIVATPVERLLVDGRLRYEIVEGASVFVEGKYAWSEAVNATQPAGDFFTFFGTSTLFAIRRDNPFLPAPGANAAVDQLFAVNPNLVLLSRFGADVGRRTTTLERDLYRVIVGVEGELPGLGWNYEAYYQYGETRATLTNEGTRNNARFRQAVDAIRDPMTNQIVCRDPAARAAGCVPLNLFGFNRSDPAALDYISETSRNLGILRQQVINGSVSGDLFKLPAGGVAFAAGVEWRKEESETRPSANLLDGSTFDGAVVPLPGAYDVLEGFAELSVPILADRPFFKLLSVEGGARYSDYSTVGGTWAWRAGAQWALSDDIRFRGGYAKAVRAPNITELFTPLARSAGSIADPCDERNLTLGINPQRRQANCRQLVPVGFRDANAQVTKSIFVSGNPDLKEETAKTITAGVVLTPRFVPRLSLKVDFYDIVLEDAIGQPNALGIVNSCVDLFDSVDNPFCPLVTRATTGLNPGAITSVRTQVLNFNRLETRGVDFEANYSLPLGGLGLDAALGLRVVGTYLEKLNVRQSANALELNKDAGQLGAPKWRFNTQAVYTQGPLTFSWMLRYVGPQQLDVQDNDAEGSDPAGFDAQTYSDLQARLRLDERFAFYLGVDNLFDNLPPRGSRTAGNNPSVIYDQAGRFLYAGVDVRF